ncbi:TetR family transcriptional regulator [Nocardioides perillae]|uniref:AcrR family transcriptional regulator n=1 Tax=Nocardioides perillae TaxID=1119534 RepID=A0A7Y9RRZ0_9ACTN|nr:AcrR family transcriptional regulator [Nocardioides perillae]
MPYRRSTAVQERLDATRSTLVQAASELVAEHGYAGCSVAAVAERAGVATGSVYRHHAGKGALFAEVFRVATAREVAAVAAALAGSGPVSERAAAGVQTFATRALRAPRMAWALLAEPVDPLVEAERLAFRRAYRDLFAALVAEGVASGELPAQDPEVTAAAVVGAIAEALVVPLHEGRVAPGTDPARSTVTALTRVVVRALGARHPLEQP